MLKRVQEVRRFQSEIMYKIRHRHMFTTLVEYFSSLVGMIILYKECGVNVKKDLIYCYFPLQQMTKRRAEILNNSFMKLWEFPDPRTTNLGLQISSPLQVLRREILHSNLNDPSMTHVQCVDVYSDDSDGR